MCILEGQMKEANLIGRVHEINPIAPLSTIIFLQPCLASRVQPQGKWHLNPVECVTLRDRANKVDRWHRHFRQDRRCEPQSQQQDRQHCVRGWLGDTEVAESPPGEPAGSTKLETGQSRRHTQDHGRHAGSPAQVSCVSCPFTEKQKSPSLPVVASNCQGICPPLWASRVNNYSSSSYRDQSFLTRSSSFLL